MLKIVHRVNTVKKLKTVPEEYGIELDLRPQGDRIILHHDAFEQGEDFEEFLEHYKHKFLILNTKSEGMEDRLLELMQKHNIQDYFFLDLSLPYLVKYSKRGIKNIAVRFSQYEPLEFCLKFKDLVNWVWVDCFEDNILDEASYKILSEHFKLCLVSPELQAKPVEDIARFKQELEGFEIAAVCTKQPDLW